MTALVKGLILIEANEANRNNQPVKARLTFDPEGKNKMLTVRSFNRAFMQEDGTASMHSTCTPPEWRCYMARGVNQRYDCNMLK